MLIKKFFLESPGGGRVLCQKMPTTECKGMMEVENLHVYNFTITRVISDSPRVINGYQAYWVKDYVRKNIYMVTRFHLSISY